jgi:hypothetical protein
VPPVFISLFRFRLFVSLCLKACATNMAKEGFLAPLARKIKLCRRSFLGLCMEIARNSTASAGDIALRQIYRWLIGPALF